MLRRLRVQVLQVPIDDGITDFRKLQLLAKEGGRKEDVLYLPLRFLKCRTESVCTIVTAVRANRLSNSCTPTDYAPITGDIFNPFFKTCF